MIKKTKILCVSDALSFKAKSYICDTDNEKIGAGKNIKSWDSTLTAVRRATHVAALRARMRETTWVLRHLKLSGINEQELAIVYSTVVRPILDYCCVIYHPMLTDEQDQQIERLQL